MLQVSNKLFGHSQEQSSSVREDECRVLGYSELVVTLKWFMKHMAEQELPQGSVSETGLLNDGGVLLDLPGASEGTKRFFSGELWESVGMSSEWAGELKMQGFLFSLRDWRCTLPVVKICNEI